MKLYYDCLLPTLDTFHLTLMELVRDGVLIVSQKLEPIYLNLKARDICQQLWNSSYSSTQLPPILSHISYQLLRNISAQTKPLIIDYQVGIGLTIRIRAFQFPNPQGQELSTPGSERHYILVFLEDRNVTLNEELKIEQRK